MHEISDTVEPTSVADIAEAVWKVSDGGRPLVVARSGMTYSLKRRVGIFAVGAAPELLMDTFIIHDDFDAVISVLSARAAGWNVQYATSWSWVWWADQSVLRVATRADGIIATSHPEGLTIRGERVTAATVAEVGLWADSDMVRRRLRVVLTSGESIVVFAEDDETPLYDPGFDFTMLDAETAWLQDLGRALARALNTGFANRLR